MAPAGGLRATDGYHWTNGVNGRVPGLIVETAIDLPRFEAGIVYAYPGIAMSAGLMALIPEERVVQIYGQPDYVCELRFSGDLACREFCYLDRGLLIHLAPVRDSVSWSVGKIMLTCPTYLHNAVAFRAQAAWRSSIVMELTDSYAVWVRMITDRSCPTPPINDPA